MTYNGGHVYIGGGHYYLDNDYCRGNYYLDNNDLGYVSHVGAYYI